MGSHIVDRLVEHGFETFIVDNLSTGLLSNINSRAFFPGPCDTGDTPDSWLNHETIAIHSAAQPKCNVSIYAPLDDLNNNYLVGVKFIVKCVSRGIRRIVLISSNSVYGKQETLPYTEDMTPAPRDPYAIHKFALEQLCQSLCKVNDIEFVILRPQHVFGERQRPNLAYRNVISRWIKKAILNQPLPVFGDLSLQRAFSPVSLISRAVVAASLEVKANGHVINLGSENLRTLEEIASQISEALNKPVKFRFLPPPPTLLSHAYGSVEKMKNLLGVSESPFEFETNFKSLVNEIKASKITSEEIGISPEIKSKEYNQTYKSSA